MIKTPDINSAGIYEVNLYINGTTVPVVIDDYFPVLPGTNTPAFCTTKH